MLEEKIRKRKARIGVVGLGYVGLPLAKTFLKSGFSVYGFDVDEKKVELLNKGKSYIKHVTTDDLIPFLNSHVFQATTDFSFLREMDVIVICVPTPLDSHRNPDLSYVIRTTEAISKTLKNILKAGWPLSSRKGRN